MNEGPDRPWDPPFLPLRPWHPQDLDEEGDPQE
jgi:hypothetical protein